MTAGSGGAISAHAYGLLRQPPVILFGAGVRRSVPSSLPCGARHVLVCTDAYISAQPEFREILNTIRGRADTVEVFDAVPAEIPVDSVVAAARGLSAARIDGIVAVGGGSCLDFAKVLSVLLTHGGHPRDYYGEFRVPAPTVPVVAVPTTAGTGSETTPVAVVYDAERSSKVGISSPHLVPAVAICDPELTYSCPPGLTAAAGADALSHCVEAFTAVARPPTPDLASARVFVGKNLLSDRYALDGITAAARSLVRAVQPDASLQTRTDVMFAALAGGLAFGTAGTTIAHALQYPIGALTGTSHGVGVGCLLPYVMEFNRPARVPEFAAIARALDPDQPESSDEVLSRRAVDSVARLLGRVGIPPTLAALGVPAGREQNIAEQALTAARLVENNPRPVDQSALATIVSAAHWGRRYELTG